MRTLLDRARPGIKEIPVYVPGRPMEELERELGIERAVKLASNENPSPPSPQVREAVMKALMSANRYPDQGCFYVKHALADHLGVGSDRIAVGNGTSELIEMLARIFVDPEDEVVIAHPSFLMYRLATKIMRGREVLVPLSDHRLDLEAMAQKISERTKMICVCNPNNPTGTMNTRAEVERLIDAVPRDVLVIFDEAYYEYAVEFDDYPRSLTYLSDRDNIVVLRSFSKVYSLAGIRIGYAVGDPELISHFDRVRQPFSVNRLAQAAAVASLQHPELIQESVAANRAALETLTEGFRRLGLEFVPSVTNFILVKFRRDAKEVAGKLERKGVIVRPLVPFGMTPEYARINTGTPEENQALLRALEEVDW